jgi:hypothetical protein
MHRQQRRDVSQVYETMTSAISAEVDPGEEALVHESNRGVLSKVFVETLISLSCHVKPLLKRCLLAILIPCSAALQRGAMPTRLNEKCRGVAFHRSSLEAMTYRIVPDALVA